MKIIIRGEKVEITDSMKDYVTEKLDKLNKYIDNTDSIEARILVKIRDHKQKVEITIPLKNFVLRAEEEKEDFYAAIDVIIDKLERQIRKNKTRLASKNIKSKATDFVYSEITDFDEEKETIVKRKTIEVKPMDEEEAILQMELLGHQFYLFKDIDTDKTVLIYKRKDGNYGIIETE